MNEKVKKILEHNRAFVKNEMYKKYETSKYPDKKIAILSCMDTRLTELLMPALGLKNGEVKLIKNAGAQILFPYDTAMLSLIVAVYELDVDTILVIGHDECGGQFLNGQEIIQKMISCGISQNTIETICQKEKDLEKWLTGFQCLNHSVHSSIEMIKNHPLIHNKIEVYGFVINPQTGALRTIE